MSPPLRVVGGGFTLSHRLELARWKRAEDRVIKSLQLEGPEPAPAPTRELPIGKFLDTATARERVATEFPGESVVVLDEIHRLLELLQNRESATAARLASMREELAYGREQMTQLLMDLERSVQERESATEARFASIHEELAARFASVHKGLSHGQKQMTELLDLVQEREAVAAASLRDQEMIRAWVRQGDEMKRGLASVQQAIDGLTEALKDARLPAKS